MGRKPPKFVRMKQNVMLAIGLVAISFMSIAQEKMTREQYINTYKKYAIYEMHRAGVPASITMAQGILESSDGNSRLATQGNNHFGIKCKSTWQGKTIHADDDAPNECFRAYNSPEESYKDHSDFLRDNWRYHELFDLAVTNYRGWAKGLRKAGYATNPQYHTILINLIERYELYKLDLMDQSDLAKPLVLQNEVPVVYAEKDETYETIAAENDLSIRQIHKYNDVMKGAKLTEGDIVYLKPKRRRGSEKSHVVKKGESMYQISQQYGIKLKHLYRRNRLEVGDEPIAGTELYMRGMRKKEDAIVTKEQAGVTEEVEEFVNPHRIEKAPPIQKDSIEVPDFHVVEQGDNIYRIAERYHVFEEDITKWNGANVRSLSIGQKIYLKEEAAKKAGINKIAPVEPEASENKNVDIIEDKAPTTVYHVVEKGETVYRITQKYGITAEQLRSWNELSGNNIFVGQKLRVSP